MTESAAGAYGLNVPVSYGLAAACLIVFLAVLRVVTRSPFWNMFLGADGRMSTSKVALFLWMLALFYAQLVITFHVYPPGNLDPGYLLLFGFPVGAAVGAKAITIGQIASGTIIKPSSNFAGKTLGRSVREIVSDDQGNLDLGDAQYFIFTLVALAVFFIALFHAPVKLPVPPDTLVGLISVSTAFYVVKKAARPTLGRH